ncbi:hypothetical protein DAPPUDRAFT_300533 [Daphnia pulex]|uniref:Cupin-like domain-containing protein n=1 Tax=Daphnia pulex TaxID=6669 RepID=E9HDA4_DAPPU|nr:hypothetical protein DAPPUDRAFT_300533 [Daphnia pulex]|eukprot:EFX70218.1 hypothetical protein DAPPUDRAFT_300533 [Daphnia pulex]
MMSASAFFSWRIILQTFIYSFVVAAVAIILNFEIQQQLWIYLTETSCLLKNNYILMEVSRPISECAICEHVTGPEILYNPTISEFTEIAYASKPLIIKGGAKHWPAIENFSFEFLVRLYDESGLEAYQSVEEECQFLPFKSNFQSLHEALHMNISVQPEGQWYIGWSNCNPYIRKMLRTYYTKPDFIPPDSESSSLDWIFMGSPGPGTTLHIDYVLRPSWQAQISGNKLWQLVPPPECEFNEFCHTFNFTAEKGDIVFIDTNWWYHNTFVLVEGGLSIAVGSEYD